MFISPGVATRGLTGVQCGIRNDHNVVCARMRCSVTTISRGRNRLWPRGLQYNARRKQIAWTSSSLCTGILAGRCSAICRRQPGLTNTKRKITIDVPLIGALIMWFAGRDQHMQLHHRECCSVSRKAKSSAARTWTLVLVSSHVFPGCLLPAVDARGCAPPPPTQAPPSNTETCAGTSGTLPLRLCVGR